MGELGYSSFKIYYDNNGSVHPTQPEVLHMQPTIGVISKRLKQALNMKQQVLVAVTFLILVYG